jgi:hypothetical protein
MIYVRNVTGTSRRRCGCGSWLDHYLSWTGSTRMVCSVLGCGSTATVGAHVRNVTRVDSPGHHRIILMCHPCNMVRGEDLALKSGVPMVWANRQAAGCYRRSA